jgi:NADH-quinone oxidoreductase subunit J
MTIVFYISSFIAIIATLAAITRINPVHALLYFILSLLAAGIIFFVLGAPFVAALIVIINAGAIMVLFLFIIMMVNRSTHTIEQERFWTHTKLWIAPCALAVILLFEIIYVLVNSNQRISGSQVISPRQVGMALFGPYLIGAELVSIIFLVGLLGAHHLAKSSHVVEHQAGGKIRG